MSETRRLEFHDSTVHGIRRDGPDAVLEMRVYVHSSTGRPGIDAGVGWYQAADVRMRDAVVEAAPLGELRIYDGTLSLDGERFENGVPLPFARSGEVRLELSGGEGAVVVRGTGISVAFTGAAGRSSGSGDGAGGGASPCAG